MTQENVKLIGAVANTLEGISLPNVFTESAIIPIYNCSKVLRQIIDSETKNQQSQEAEEAPKEETVNDTADSVE